MKYKIKILQGREVIMEGKLVPTKKFVKRLEDDEEGSYNKDFKKMIHPDIDEIVFDIERAINSQTEVRAHIEAK